MEYVLHPWQLFVLAIAAWINREQDKRIEYLRTENEILREKLGKKRVLLDDDQRRRLAVKGKALGRKALFEVASVVSPDTILRWHRQLVARKWDYSERRTSRLGRPRIRTKVIRLVIRFARENPSWGYDRIQGALRNVGHHLSDSTVANVLKKNGIEPAPNRQRRTSWNRFLKAIGT